jgi:NAD(P)-dependent dehydrogenase (short-subunit alcohol dehydrogenase family)
MSKVVLITGASSGLGQALAQQLHKEGHIVYGTSRQPAPGTPFRTLRMDVRDNQSVNHALQAIANEQGRLDWLFNNAGISIAAPVEQVKISSAETVIDTNVLGVLRVTKASLPLLRKSTAGKIINISSIGSVVGLPFRGIYCASKAGLDLLSDSLRLELEPFGIQSCTIRAGDIQTNINQSRIKEYDEHDDTYHHRFIRTYEKIEKEVEKGLTAEEAAQKIIKIARTKRLRPTYNIGKFMQKLGIVIKRLAPSNLYEWALKLYLH